MKNCRLYEKLEKGAVRCKACRHYCRIGRQAIGICGVRKNENGELKLLVYGKASAVHMDPIEKKPLFHFLPNTEIFSIGTVGCNFGCEFCQNWDLSQATKYLKRRLLRESKQKDYDFEIGEFGYELSPESIVLYCLENKVPSIAYTYNEPSIFFEYTYDTSRLAHAEGIKNVYVSNGYQSDEAIEMISPYLDAINVDLKSFRDDFYRKICKARLHPVLDAIKKYYKMGIWMEITTLLIPGKNDSEEEIRDIAEFICSISKKIPWHISKFHPAYKMSNIASTSLASLKKAYEIGKIAGLEYVYIGNVNEKNLSSSFCPKCHNILVDRNLNHTKVIGLEVNKCKKCGEVIPGVWNNNN